ncbi:MAG TPA: YggT family protein [Chloroflexi bacterium]|nr:YggT family protein [Chloroflexota bacterium]
MNPVVTILSILNVFLNLYGLLLLLRVLVSWMRLDPYTNPVARFLYAVTEPVLAPIRAVLPSTGMIDFSPLVAMILIFALQRLLGILATML